MGYCKGLAADAADLDPPSSCARYVESLSVLLCRTLPGAGCWLLGQMPVCLPAPGPAAPKLKNRFQEIKFYLWWAQELAQALLGP